jgi:hypothetical protein
VVDGAPAAPDDAVVGDPDVVVGDVPVCDAQPDTRRRLAAAAPTARRGYLRMPPIYATLAAVMDATRIQECCQA